MNDDEFSGEGFGEIIATCDQEKEEANALDRACLPYATKDVPYTFAGDRQALKIALGQILRGKYDAGKILLRIKNHETVPTLVQVLEEFALPKMTAWRYMRFAFYCANSERFRKLFDQPKMMNRGMALFEGLNDPEVVARLASFEETGELCGLTEEEIINRPVRELQRENRRLRKEKLLIEEKAQQENDNLKRKLEALEEELDDPELKKSQKLLIKGEGQITEGMATLAKADCELLAKDAYAVALARLLIDRMRRVADFIEVSVFSAAKARQEGKG